MVNKCADQAGYLRKHDNVEGINRCLLYVHGEKVKQNDKINRSSTDAKKCGHDAKSASNQDADYFCSDMEGGYMLLKNIVHQGSGRDNKECRCLNCTDSLTVREYAYYIVVQIFSANSPDDGSRCQQRCRLSAELGAGSTIQIFYDRDHRHCQHSTAGKETDCVNGKDSHGIQCWFDDHTASNAADRADDRGQKADKSRDQAAHISSTLCWLRIL